jgi:oxygen-independent coproporphyrinogen-3 oxidase
VYVHVPYCRRRCGYCDFNTYVGDGEGYAAVALAEMELAAAWLEERWAGGGGRPATTVFFGGGTPTVLPARDLVALLDGVRARFGLAPEAEVTVEANPDTVNAGSLRELAAGGFTRVSYGMQSFVPSVLQVLDRTHDAARLPEVVDWARVAGLDVSCDLIYGTPGETIDEWRASLEAVVAMGLSHVSCYALTIEPGTPLWRRVQSGAVADTDEDDLVTKYELADSVLGEGGLGWYEISNWAVPGAECRHNLGYWTGADWWGIGPGAHSAIGSERFWNVRLPRAYESLIAAGRLPWAGCDVPDAAGLVLEHIMLGVRLAQGLDLDVLGLPGSASRAVAEGTAGKLADDGLLDEEALGGRHRAVLTLRGRMLADIVTRELAP